MVPKRADADLTVDILCNLDMPITHRIDEYKPATILTIGTGEKIINGIKEIINPAKVLEYSFPPKRCTKSCNTEVKTIRVIKPRVAIKKKSKKAKKVFARNLPIRDDIG